MTATSKAASLIGVAMAALSLALAPVDANAARRRDVATPATTPRPAAALPPAVASILRASGLPASSFAVSVRSVETPDVPPLLAFNLGVETGQLAIVILILPMLLYLRKTTWFARFGSLGLSALVIAAGVVWFCQRAFA